MITSVSYPFNQNVSSFFKLEEWRDIAYNDMGLDEIVRTPRDIDKSILESALEKSYQKNNFPFVMFLIHHQGISYEEMRRRANSDEFPEWKESGFKLARARYSQIGQNFKREIRTTYRYLHEAFSKNLEYSRLVNELPCSENIKRTLTREHGATLTIDECAVFTYEYLIHFRGIGKKSVDSFCESLEDRGIHITGYKDNDITPKESLSVTILDTTQKLNSFLQLCRVEDGRLAHQDWRLLREIIELNGTLTKFLDKRKGETK
jgi:hypothetical protein